MTPKLTSRAHISTLSSGPTHPTASSTAIRGCLQGIHKLKMSETECNPPLYPTSSSSSVYFSEGYSHLICNESLRSDSVTSLSISHPGISSSPLPLLSILPPLIYQPFSIIPSCNDLSRLPSSLFLKTTFLKSFPMAPLHHFIPLLSSSMTHSPFSMCQSKKSFKNIPNCIMSFKAFNIFPILSELKPKPNVIHKILNDWFLLPFQSHSPIFLLFSMIPLPWPLFILFIYSYLHLTIVNGS